MKQVLLKFAALAIAACFQLSPTHAQLNLLDPVPGGATGANVFCVQTGDLNSGLFIGTFLQKNGGVWGETPRQAAYGDHHKYVEKSRTESTVELYDAGRKISLQFDFARKKIRFSRSTPGQNWRDYQHMLNATDQEGSSDCAFLASVGDDANGSTSQGAAPARRAGSTEVLIKTIQLGTEIVIPPNTQMTATSGPPCPGQPGFFLCPNKFTCAPNGAVCCPGVGSCGPGNFCDRFVPGSCIGPGDPAFCQGTGNPVTGVSLHCAPGSVCLPGNICNP